MSSMAAVESLTVYAVSLYCWKNLYSFSSLLIFQRKKLGGGGDFPIYLSELILSGKICSIIVATLTAHHTPILGSYNDTLCILGLYTNHFKYFEYLHDCLSNLIHKISCTGPVSLLYDVS
jgi:hypothetical protein